MTSTHILFHSPCLDGFTAAYAAWKKFGDAAHYSGCRYEEPLPEIADGAHVYILDLSFPRADLIALAERCHVVLIDHHESEEGRLAGLPFVKFDMSKSGCVLAWEYFHPEKMVPQLFLQVQDRDLWEFKLNGTDEIMAALWHESRDFGVWDNLVQRPAEIMRLFAKGSETVKHRNSNIRHQMYSAFVTAVHGHIAVCCNSILYPSEMARAMFEKFPEAKIAVMFYMTSSGAWKWSLRSRKGGPNVAELAAKLAVGGGGHACAAGAETDWYPRASY